MVNEQDFQTHLQALKPEHWDRLFQLLPKIENTKNFGEVINGNKLEDGSIQMPYWSSANIVHDFFQIFHDINLCVNFDWGSWTEGMNMLHQKDFDFNKLDKFTLCNLLTVIVRADRFNEGFLVLNFDNGIIPKIIKAIKQSEKIESVISLQQIKSVLFGIAVGDALGVPVEFKSRETIYQNPVTDMIGYGTHNLPAGTWSDDSSLTFCLAEALTNGFDLNLMGQNFVKWANENYWTPRGNVFDIGIATRHAIDRLAKGERSGLAGGFDESSNGNGSLMRILPLLFHLLDKPINERYEITKQVSSITHGHIRSVIACFYFLEFARQIFSGKDKFATFKDLQTEITNHLKNISVNPAEITLFDRLLKSNIHELHEDEIQSSGYVLHTLEASIWCLLTTGNYKEAVLKAVNLGSDTDTTGAVTGGLAGLLYGLDNISEKWITQIARKEDIENLAERLANKLASQ